MASIGLPCCPRVRFIPVARTQIPTQIPLALAGLSATLIGGQRQTENSC